jgi:hypothetical protein
MPSEFCPPAALDSATCARRCNICGGVVDLRDATPPRVSFGKGAKDERAPHRTEGYARFMAEHAGEAHRNGVTGRRNIMAVRNDALEKAAQIADAYASREPDDVGAAIASDIRAMLRDIP